MKKGISLLATNARESIKLIDKMTSYDDGFFDMPQHLDDLNASFHQDKNPFKARLVIQSPDEVGPRYEKCLKYKVRTPLVRDFPNHKTDLDSMSVAGLKKANSHSKESLKANSRAEIPARLRYLIRTCVHKEFVENKDTAETERTHWLVITEDPITKIWLRSFQLETMNLRELETALNPSSASQTETRELYNYTSPVDQVQPKKSNRGKNHKKPAEEAIKMKFDQMDYADRGVGQLWTP